ncbi:hypothetical protein B0H15DRAFT_149725 [Mycena belliarum]|uniref:RING-type domain-containing protein n=1 Tax=Mycena belliarum TaxID=1033014 RepID=A0AAD6XTB7_9AGAR|nr:hypothetical protein B0H15DRAFT_149725 [Mycena belliae]
MPANTRSTKNLARQNSDVILLSDPPSPDKFGLKRAPPKPKQNTARKENQCTVNLGDIIEISSDEDEEPVARSTVATFKLQERIRVLEKENARIKKENEEIKKQQTVVADVEDQVTCEVCAAKMWSPFILPDCGHTFCQRDLEDWFATSLKQHRKVYPNYDVNTAPVNIYGVVQRLPLPAYSCPKCRQKVRSKPIQNFALKGLVRIVADKVGESSPKKLPGSSANVWSRFFPADPAQ